MTIRVITKRSVAAAALSLMTAALMFASCVVEGDGALDPSLLNPTRTLILPAGQAWTNAHRRGDDEISNCCDGLIFRDNGVCHWIDDYTAENWSKYNIGCTWSSNNSTVTLVAGDGTFVFNYTLLGDTLTLGNSDGAMVLKITHGVNIPGISKAADVIDDR